MAPVPDLYNIGSTGRSRRRALGLASLVLAVALSAILWITGTGPVGRLALAPLFLGGFLGILQSQEHT